MKPNKKTYEEEVNNLLQAINIAIIVIQENGASDNRSIPLNNFHAQLIEEIKNSGPQFRNLKSLSYKIDDLFTFFQEGSGIIVDKFWEKIKESNLPYKRVNRIAKILKRGKIKNDIEYQFIIDVMQPYLTEGVFTEEEYAQVNGMIDAFENRKKR